LTTTQGKIQVLSIDIILFCSFQLVGQYGDQVNMFYLRESNPKLELWTIYRAALSGMFLNHFQNWLQFEALKKN